MRATRTIGSPTISLPTQTLGRGPRSFSGWIATSSSRAWRRPCSRGATRTSSWRTRAPRRESPHEAASRLAPLGDARAHARAAGRLLRRSDRRRGLRELLLVGPAHAAAFRRHGELPRARRARRAFAHGAPHLRL